MQYSNKTLGGEDKGAVVVTHLLWFGINTEYKVYSIGIQCWGDGGGRGGTGSKWGWLSSTGSDQVKYLYYSRSVVSVVVNIFSLSPWKHLCTSACHKHTWIRFLVSWRHRDNSAVTHYNLDDYNRPSRFSVIIKAVLLK